MKKLLLFLLLKCFIYNSVVYSQNNSTSSLKKIEFTSINGYNVSNPLSSIYDDKGWLWILGENKLSSEFVLGDKEIILQRFDGNNFFTLKIPFKFENKITKGSLFKNKKGGLYLKLWFSVNSKTQLFFINTDSLDIKRVLAYDKLIKKRQTDNLYYLNNKTKILVTHEEKLFSAELDGMQIKMLDSIKYDKPNKSLFIHTINIFGKNVIVKLLSNEFFLIDENGKFVKMLTKKDFIDVNGNHFLPTTLNNNFSLKGEHYFYFDSSYGQIKFNKITRKFEEQNRSKKLNSLLYVDPLSQEENKMIFQIRNNKGFELDLYDVINNSFQLKHQIKVEKFHIVSYRDLGKDLAVLSQNKLELYFFESNKIKTFLKEKSIRAINYLSESKYVIATDTEGFYEVDVKNGTEKEIQFTFNNKSLPIQYPRDIIIEDSLIITNSINNVFFSDRNYTILSAISAGHPSVEMIKVGDNIFIGGQYGRVFKLNIKEKIKTELKNTVDILIKEFATDGKKVFATTTKGIFKYENGRFDVYQFDEVKTEDFLSIKYTLNYGILVTTKFGEIYQYDDKKNEITLFYKDALRASIVGIEVDNDKKLWLNTYAGIVSFNPKNKAVKRYTKKDGVYELEGNRYSTFKDKKGNIFIGSFNGVSFFNPKELEENTLKLKPIISSVSSFNTQNKKWNILTSPSELNSLKQLILPPSNQRFTATVSVLGIVNPSDIKYRYRLLEDNNESSWIRLYNGNEIIFSNLASGEYTLQVEALTLANQKIGKTVELKIVSKIVFYKTWWFALIGLIVILSVLSYFFYQLKEKEKLHAENTIAINKAKIKEAMMLEIHHRIKNNLQVVSGLLSLQANNSDNVELKTKLQDSQSRIESIAGIHNILYSSDNQESVSVKKHFNKIINYNKTLFPVPVTYKFNIDGTNLYMDKAIPLALILNELINNSYKHAFQNQQQPQINVGFIEEVNSFKFSYSDNGIFKEKRGNKISMGMKIVHMMVTQLKGTYQIQKDKNFAFELVFLKD